ncbi:hypothetical protein Q2941_08450 [Bradyrhizobium sp. UFLA05-153]|uniref:hypothetical protein n=1 Tax=Bradyrhizobium sp. Ec3.3 TaxID=189753 RepID=UPI000419F1C7|nr:hypothetical protein [Bradyrhizobium sp. Ec3.3]
MQAVEMRARAIKCAELAKKANPITRYFYIQAAQQWHHMAAQLELLERERVYRIIRDRPE